MGNCPCNPNVEVRLTTPEQSAKQGAKDAQEHQAAEQRNAYDADQRNKK